MSNQANIAKAMITLCMLIMILVYPMGIRAETLDEVINQNQQAETSSINGSTSISGYVSSDDYINSLKGATSLTEERSDIVDKVNSATNRAVSIVVQILAYAIVAGLTLRVLIDLAYIAIPFMRKALSSEAGQAQQMQGNNMQQANMSMQNNNTTKIQWISNAARIAVASEQNGMNPYKVYVKDMVILLVVTPLLLILTMTGALTKLGLLIGDVIIKAIGSFGSLF